MTQEALWESVNRIKARVLNMVGGDINELSHAFRSTEAFLRYIALCGEAQVDYDDGELSEKVVEMLQEAAQQVEDLWAGGMR